MRSVQKRAVRLPEGRRKVCIVHRRRGERKEDGGRKSVLGFLSALLPQLFAPFPAGLAKMPGQLGIGYLAAEGDSALESFHFAFAVHTTPIFG